MNDCSPTLGMKSSLNTRDKHNKKFICPHPYSRFCLRLRFIKPKNCQLDTKSTILLLHTWKGDRVHGCFPVRTRLRESEWPWQPSHGASQKDVLGIQTCVGFSFQFGLSVPGGGGSPFLSILPSQCPHPGPQRLLACDIQAGLGVVSPCCSFINLLPSGHQLPELLSPHPGSGGDPSTSGKDHCQFLQGNESGMNRLQLLYGC